MSYKTGDIISKVISKTRDVIFLCYWKLVLGSIGKGSVIKKGVIIDGNPKRIKIGKKFKIWERCILGVGRGEIVIGDNGLLGVNTYLNASEGKIIIGNNVAISAYCQFYSYSHHFYPEKKVTECYKIGDIIIEDNVLIGSNVIVLPGVIIHKGVIVAAGSVIVNNLEPYKIYAGIPAREIGQRK